MRFAILEDKKRGGKYQIFANFTRDERLRSLASDCKADPHSVYLR